jgi:hypothetical protein
MSALAASAHLSASYTMLSSMQCSVGDVSACQRATVLVERKRCSELILRVILRYLLFRLTDFFEQVALSDGQMATSSWSPRVR